MKEKNTIGSKRKKEDEIDLIALAKFIWNEKRVIIRTTIIFVIIGLFIAIFSPEKYKATTIMVPQMNNGEDNLGGLGNIAAIAGFNLNMSGSSQLSPKIYPQILKSMPFQLELMHTKLKFENINNKISLFEYFTDSNYSKFNLIEFIKKFTIGLPNTITSALKGKEEDTNITSNNRNKIIRISQSEKRVCDLLSKLIIINIDSKNGLITLTVIMPNAHMAAQIGQFAQNLLQKYITEFKIEKAQAQLDFVKDRYNEKKNEFEEAQKRLAQFRDQNRNVSTALAKTEEERLYSEYQIAQSVFTELAKRLENYRIQVKEETPVFSVIEPISIPSDRFKPQRKIVLIIWTLVGIILGGIIIIGKYYWDEYKQKWQESNH